MNINNQTTTSTATPIRPRKASTKINSACQQKILSTQIVNSGCKSQCCINFNNNNNSINNKFNNQSKSINQNDQVKGQSLNDNHEEDEVCDVNSFIYERDVEDEYDEDDDDDDDDDNDVVNNEFELKSKNNHQTQSTSSSAYFSLDNDTKAKLELLLANAGIESITSDLFKDPHVMQTLTSTYVKTLNETKSQLLQTATELSHKNDNQNVNETNTHQVNEDDEGDSEECTINKQENNHARDLQEFESQSKIKEIIESTLDEFILASESEHELDDEDNESACIHATHEHDDFEQNNQLGIKSSSEITAANAETILSKLIEMQSNTLNMDETNSPARNNKQKTQQGKSLTELLEENADSVLGLACASGYIELVTVLLAINANVEDKGHKNESTPLMEACANGHKQIVQLLLKHGAKVNAQSACGNTSLHYAVQHNHIDIVRLLIESGARIEEANGNGHTPLMEAASAAHVECARLLIDAGANVNTHSYEFKETALTLACYKGNVDMVRFLLEKGADQEHKTDEMHTALMEACMDGHVEVARLLLEHNAQVNMPPDSFESPLTLAACGGHVELANLLIEQGADLEERNDEGYTPLMEAAREGHEEMVALLLFHDADINAITEETQETALTLACCGGCFEVAKFLIEAGADVNLGASTPLMEASQEGHIELVQLLLRSNALVNQCTSSGETALSLASENGHTDVCDLLVRAGAHVDVPDPEKGFTSMMKASRAGHVCTVQFLLSKGANINQATPYTEHTVLSLACGGGHVQVVEILLANGADPCTVLKDNSNCLLEAAKGGHEQIVRMLLEWPKNVPQVAIQQQQQQQLQAHKQVGKKLHPDIVFDDVSLSQVDFLSTKPDIALENLVNMLHKLAFGENSERVVKKVTSTPPKQANIKTPTKDEQIKRKEILLKELQKIEKQLEDKAETQTRINSLALSSSSSSTSTTANHGPACTSCSVTATSATNHKSSLNEMTNYQKICMINKYLITKCEDDLNKIRDEKQNKPTQKKSSKSEINCHLLQEDIFEHMKTFDGRNTTLQQQEAELFKHLNISSGSTSTLSPVPPPPPPPPPLLPPPFSPQTKPKPHPQQQYQQQANNKKLLKQSAQAQTTKTQEQIISKTLIEFENFYTSNQPDDSVVKKVPIVKSIDLEAKTESNHDTALTLACSGGYEELVRLLIERGANIEHRDKKGFTPLILASTNGFVKCVQMLLVKGADVEAQSERTKDTPLSAACQAGKFEVVELLLKNNANKEHRNISDYTPLSLAASGGYVNIIKLLLQYGCEINSRTGSKLGISPLMLAAMNGHTQTVKLLLDMGSDINAQIETNRNTALTLACFQGRHDVVALLLDRKANIEHRAKSGLTPLMEAASGGYEQVGRVLLERGADINAQPVPVSKDTALTIASEKGHLKFVHLLLDNGAQIEVKKKKGCTPLWLACNSGHLEVCVALVQHGANTDAEDTRKISCLMAAFRNGHDRVVKYMVKHVKQFPSDADCMRFIATITDKELLKKCTKCKETILSAKEKQTQEANRAANNLLKELDLEKNREKSKKEAAARKREKRKLKKKQQQEKNQVLAQDLAEDAKKSGDESESEQDAIKPPPTNKKSPATIKKEPIEVTSSLGALDDFEIFEPKVPMRKKNDMIESGWKQVSHNPKPKRVYIPHSHLSRVLGRSNCNMKSIYELTGCSLEVEDKKYSNGSEKSVILLKGTAENAKHAHELILELMNNPDVELSMTSSSEHQSLPNDLQETQKLSTSKSNISLNMSKASIAIKNASSMGKLQTSTKQQWSKPIVTSTTNTTTKPISASRATPISRTSQSYNPPMSSTLISSLDLKQVSKPLSTDTSKLNFAEVAKLGSSTINLSATKRQVSTSPKIELQAQPITQVRILKTDHSRMPLQPILTQTQAKIDTSDRILASRNPTKKPISVVTPLTKKEEHHETAKQENLFSQQQQQQQNQQQTSITRSLSINELSQQICQTGLEMFEATNRNLSLMINQDNNGESRASFTKIIRPPSSSSASSMSTTATTTTANLNFNVNLNMNMNLGDLTLTASNLQNEQVPIISRPAPIGAERNNRAKQYQQQQKQQQQQLLQSPSQLTQPATTTFIHNHHQHHQDNSQFFNGVSLQLPPHSNSTSPKSLVPTPSPTSSSYDSWKYHHHQQQQQQQHTNGFMMQQPTPPQPQPIPIQLPMHLHLPHHQLQFSPNLQQPQLASLPPPNSFHHHQHYLAHFQQQQQQQHQQQMPFINYHHHQLPFTNTNGNIIINNHLLESNDATSTAAYKWNF